MEPKPESHATDLRAKVGRFRVLLFCRCHNNLVGMSAAIAPAHAGAITAANSRRKAGRTGSLRAEDGFLPPLDALAAAERNHRMKRSTGKQRRCIAATDASVRGGFGVRTLKAAGVQQIPEHVRQAITEREHLTPDEEAQASQHIADAVASLRRLYGLPETGAR